jgi:hypothetical protein
MMVGQATRGCLACAGWRSFQFRSENFGGLLVNRAALCAVRAEGVVEDLPPPQKLGADTHAVLTGLLGMPNPDPAEAADSVCDHLLPP